MYMPTIKYYKKLIGGIVKNINLKESAKKLNYDDYRYIDTEHGSVRISTRTHIDKDRLFTSIEVSIHNVKAEISLLSFIIDECEYSKLIWFIRYGIGMVGYKGEFINIIPFKIKVTNLVMQLNAKPPEFNYITIGEKPDGYEFSVCVDKKCYTKALIDKGTAISFLCNKLNLGYNINTAYEALRELYVGD